MKGGKESYECLGIKCTGRGNSKYKDPEVAVS